MTKQKISQEIIERVRGLKFDDSDWRNYRVGYNQAIDEVLKILEGK